MITDGCTKNKSAPPSAESVEAEARRLAIENGAQSGARCFNVLKGLEENDTWR